MCVCDCVCGVFLPGSSQQGAVYFTHLLFLLDGITHDMKFEPCSIFFFLYILGIGTNSLLQNKYYRRNDYMNTCKQMNIRQCEKKEIQKFIK